jgi:hypothetical protein
MPSHGYQEVYSDIIADKNNETFPSNGLLFPKQHCRSPFPSPLAQQINIYNNQNHES